MEFKPWMKNITIEDLPNEDLKFIANEAGLKYAMLIIFLFPGVSVTIPNNPFAKLKENYIIRKYDGTKTSINKLAIECDLTQRHIYRLLKKKLNITPEKDSS